MRVGVTGSNGRLGKVLVRCGLEPCDLNNARDFDVIVHTKAYTGVDSAENNIRECLYNNFIFTENLRQDTCAKIIYISTDFIFDGKHGPYVEDSEPNPISVYGWSKWLGERCLMDTDLVVRTTVLYDSHKPDFVTWILKQLKAGGSVAVSRNMITSPTNIQYLAEAILYLIDHPISYPILNVCGRDIISRYNFAKLVAEIFGYDPYFVYPTGRKDIGVAKRPLRAGLQTTVAETLGVPIYSVREGLELMRDDNEHVQILCN